MAGVCEGVGKRASLVVTHSSLRRKVIVSGSDALGGNDPRPPETMMGLGGGHGQAIARRQTRTAAKTKGIPRMSLI
jgi:hypothetical protein